MKSSLTGLRAATRDLHERLHSHPAFTPLTGAAPDLPGYVRLLARLHGFHAPVEHWLFAAGERLLPELDDLPLRRKADRLLADLAALSASVPDPLPQLTVTGELTRSTLLGGLYVIEGATLGGRELARRLAPTLAPLGLAAPAGCRFLLSYEDRQAAMWRRFCGVLEAVAADFTAAEQAAMADAARGLFTLFGDWLTRSRETAVK